MFHISRRSYNMHVYWTGAEWAKDKAKAKGFTSKDEARAEIKAWGIVWTCAISK